MKAAKDYFGSESNAQADMLQMGSESVTAAYFGVQVMNLQSGTVRAQDQIVWNGGGHTNVPDGGATLILLGVALGGVSFLRRKLS